MCRPPPCSRLLAFRSAPYVLCARHSTAPAPRKAAPLAVGGGAGACAARSQAVARPHVSSFDHRVCKDCKAILRSHLFSGSGGRELASERGSSAETHKTRCIRFQSAHNWNARLTASTNRLVIPSSHQLSHATAVLARTKHTHKSRGDAALRGRGARALQAVPAGRPHLPQLQRQAVSLCLCGARGSGSGGHGDPQVRPPRRRRRSLTHTTHHH